MSAENVDDHFKAFLAVLCDSKLDTVESGSTNLPTLSEFRNYLSRQHCEESLLFFHDVNAYRRLYQLWMTETASSALLFNSSSINVPQPPEPAVRQVTQQIEACMERQLTRSSTGSTHLDRVGCMAIWSRLVLRRQGSGRSMSHGKPRSDPTDTIAAKSSMPMHSKPHPEPHQLITAIHGKRPATKEGMIKALRRHCQQITDTYLAEGAVWEVNVSAKHRNACLNSQKNGNVGPDLWNEVVDEVVQLLYLSMWRSYVLQCVVDQRPSRAIDQSSARSSRDDGMDMDASEKNLQENFDSAYHVVTVSIPSR